MPLNIIIKCIYKNLFLLMGIYIVGQKYWGVQYCQRKNKKGKAFGEFQRCNFFEITPAYDDLDYNAIFCEGVFLQLMPLIFYLRKNSA